MCLAIQGSHGPSETQQAHHLNAQPHCWLRAARRTRKKKPRRSGASSIEGACRLRQRQTHRHHITVRCTAQGRLAPVSRPRRTNVWLTATSPAPAQSLLTNQSVPRSSPAPVVQIGAASVGKVTDAVLPQPGPRPRHRAPMAAYLPMTIGGTTTALEPRPGGGCNKCCPTAGADADGVRA